MKCSFSHEVSMSKRANKYRIWVQLALIIIFFSNIFSCCIKLKKINVRVIFVEWSGKQNDQCYSRSYFFLRWEYSQKQLFWFYFIIKMMENRFVRFYNNFLFSVNWQLEWCCYWEQSTRSNMEFLGFQVETHLISIYICEMMIVVSDLFNIAFIHKD